MGSDDRGGSGPRLQRLLDRWMQTGGRAGRHSEHLGPMLAEMQVLHRVDPAVAAR